MTKPPDRRAIADYLAALSENELNDLVAEARDTGEDMRALARSIFSTDPDGPDGQSRAVRGRSASENEARAFARHIFSTNTED